MTLVGTWKRRWAVAFGLAVTLHLLLLVPLAFYQPPPPSPLPPTGAPSMTLRWETEPDPAPPPMPAPPRVEVPAEITPALVPTPILANSVPTPSGPPGTIGEGQGTGAAPLLAVPGSKGGQPPRVVYVLDRSLSMGQSGGLRRASGEIVASLRTLPPGAVFLILPYNRTAHPLRLAGQGDFVGATVIEEAISQLEELTASGSTDHLNALRLALRYRPDIIFFLTDADDLTPDTIRTITRLNDGRACIHVAEWSDRAEGGGSLARLAFENRGGYRKIRSR